MVYKKIAAWIARITRKGDRELPKRIEPGDAVFAVWSNENGEHFKWIQEPSGPGWTKIPEDELRKEDE